MHDFGLSERISTLDTVDGESAAEINSAGSSLYFTISIFSPPMPAIMLSILALFAPIHAPIASTFSFFEQTAIFVLL